MSSNTRAILLCAVSSLGSIVAIPAFAQDFITVASTTSTENSGLFGHILPLFSEETGIEVRVVAQGTGQALETGRRGDFDVMYNDFVIVGPDSDPAKTRAAQNAADAMTAIAQAGAAFASRGDDSGTHQAEQALWSAAGIVPEGAWYLETGSGMGATLNTAVQVPAYALTDRGTWLSFANRGDLTITYEGDPVLFNPYGVILVNPERHAHVKAQEGQAFIDWLVSDAGQQAIAAYQVGGDQLFFPNAQ